MTWKSNHNTVCFYPSLLGLRNCVYTCSVTTANNASPGPPHLECDLSTRLVYRSHVQLPLLLLGLSESDTFMVHFSTTFFLKNQALWHQFSNFYYLLINVIWSSLSTQGKLSNNSLENVYNFMFLHQSYKMSQWHIHCYNC